MAIFYFVMICVCAIPVLGLVITGVQSFKNWKSRKGSDGDGEIS